jgi:hypothetical protein
MKRAQNAVVRASKSLRGFVSAVESIPATSKLTAEQLEASAWAAALASPVAPDVVPPGWLTTREIAAKLGKSDSTVGTQLARAVREGRAKRQNFRIHNAGTVRPVPHYKPAK